MNRKEIHSENWDRILWYRAYKERLAEKIKLEVGENHYESVCSYFGCGRHLTIREQLFGNRCIKHQYERTERGANNQ